MKLRSLVPLILVLGCSGKSQQSQTQSIIGKNDLKALASNPSKHGLLNTGDRECNAFLVGSNLVATALHCVGDDPLSFVGFKFTHATEASSQVIDLTFLDDTKDLVTYQVDHAYSDYYTTAPLNLAAPVDLFAYDHEVQAYVTDSCKVTRVLSKSGAFEHTCDTKKKFSGSVLAQNGKIVGMHIGYDPKHKRNLALDFSQITNDQTDIVDLEVEIDLEWPHVRSPHIRQDHLRSPIPIPLPGFIPGLSDLTVTGKPFWGNGPGACGSSWSAQIVPEKWGIPGQVANFAPACTAHDRCYELQLGKSKCDQDLKEALINICDSSFRNDFFYAQRVECRNTVSNVYLASVKLFGVGPYNACRNGGCLGPDEVPPSQCIMTDFVLDKAASMKIFAVDETDSEFIYWVDTRDNTLRKGGRSSGGSRLATVSIIDDNATVAVLAVHRGIFYWVDTRDNALHTGDIDKSTGKLRTTGIIDPNASELMLAVSGDWVYWKDSRDGTARRGKVVGGQLKTFDIIDPAASELSISPFYAGSDSIMWTDSRDGSTRYGKIGNGKLSTTEILDRSGNITNPVNAGGSSKTIFWLDKSDGSFRAGHAGTCR